MRYYFQSIERARRLAKSLRAELAKDGVSLGLAESRNLLSRMNGYRSWDELARVIGTVAASPADSEVDADVLAARRRERASALAGLVSPERAMEIVSRVFHVPDRSPLSVSWRKGELGIIADGPDHIYRVAPVGPGDFPRQSGPGYALRAALRNGPAVELQDKFLMGFGIFETIEEAKREAEHMILIRRAELVDMEARRDVLCGPEVEDLETQWGRPDEVWIYGPGLWLFKFGWRDVFRLAPDLLCELPAALRFEPDEAGFAWYQDELKPILVVRFPQFFSDLDLRVARLELERDMPVVAGILSGQLPETAKIMRKGRSEVKSRRPQERFHATGPTPRRKR